MKRRQNHSLSQGTSISDRDIDDEVICFEDHGSEPAKVRVRRQFCVSSNIGSSNHALTIVIVSVRPAPGDGLLFYGIDLLADFATCYVEKVTIHLRRLQLGETIWYAFLNVRS